MSPLWRSTHGSTSPFQKVLPKCFQVPFFRGPCTRDAAEYNALMNGVVAAAATSFSDNTCLNVSKCCLLINILLDCMIPKSSFESGSSNWVSVQNGEAWPEGFENGNLRHCSTAAQHCTALQYPCELRPVTWGLVCLVSLVYFITGHRGHQTFF